MCDINCGENESRIGRGGLVMLWESEEMRVVTEMSVGQRKGKRRIWDTE